MSGKRSAMLALILAAALVLNLWAQVGAAEQWVPFNGAAPSATVGVDVITSNYQEVVADIDTPGMQVSDVTEEGVIYQVLSVSDAGQTSEIGKPELPMIGRYVAIPAGATASVDVVDYDATILEGYNVQPAQEPQPDIKDAPRPAFRLDRDTYGQDDYFPSVVARLEGPYVIRGCSVMILQVFPVQFNPVQQSLRVLSNIRVRVNFKGGESRFVDNRLRSPSFDQMFDRLLLNAPEVNADPSPEAAYQDGNSLLIITHPNFQAAADTLARWKREKGIVTEVRSTTQTGSTAAAIQSYIQSAYDNWSPPPTYVMFIGDAEFIPTHYVTTHPYTDPPYQGRVGTDIYYATVDGSDYFPDISAGRISVDTLTQANKRVNDIINYERTPITLSSFYQNVAVCAYFQHAGGGYADRRFAQTSEDLAIYFSDSSYLGDYGVDRIYYTPSSVTPLYWSTRWFSGGPAGDAGDPIPSYLRKDVPPYFPWDGDATDISSAVNAGRFLVTHRDHGGRSGWGDPYYNTGHVNALTNGDRLPVVWSMNCQTGWFDNETDDAVTGTSTTEVNFTEAWERNPNGGAVGLIGATRISYSGHNDRLCWGWTDALWPGFLTYSPSGTPFDAPAWEMGAVLNYGKYYYATTYGDSPARKVGFEMFHWYGDPTMQLWTAVPQSLSVTHDSAVAAGGTSFDVTVSACTGAVIAISKDGQLLGRAYTTGGTSTISWSTPIAAGDQILVTVTGHNYRPYQATVDCGDICECDLNNDGVCDMVDYYYFGLDWGRKDCPITTASAEVKKIVEPNDRDTGNPDDPAAAKGGVLKSRRIEEAIPDFNAALTPAAPAEATGMRSSRSQAAPELATDIARKTATPAAAKRLWESLQSLSDADKANAMLKFETGREADSETATELRRIESLWHLGQYAQAVEALMLLEGEGVEMALGIAWKTPKTVEKAEWITGDVQIGARTDLAEATLEYDAQTGNLFAVLRLSDASLVWTVNISTDDGATWQETFQWILLDPGDTIVDVSASVVDNYLYVGYVAEGDGVATTTAARMRRFAVSNGAVDTAYGYKIVFDKGVAIKEVSLSSNADDWDNRIYYYAILADFKLIHYWADQEGTAWIEMNTGITDAWQGLDSTWNEGNSTGSGASRFVSYVGYILEGAEVVNPIVVARRNNAGVWDRTVVDADPYYSTLTGISAFEDTVITVFEYLDASSNRGIKYWISYNGGDNYYWGHVAAAQSGTSYFKPDVAARGSGGIIVIYQEEVGEPDPLWHRHRDYATANWSTPEQINEIDVVTGAQLAVEYVPPLPGSSYAYGVYWKSWDPDGAWFDRSDGGAPVDPCECDLNNDGVCDMLDYYYFGLDWGRKDCP